jgi:hypothetical protein
MVQKLFGLNLIRHPISVLILFTCQNCYIASLSKINPANSHISKMAKSSRASNIKANNAALKAKVFGPVEAERNARLHAKLMALVSAPKPSEQKETDVSMDAQGMLRKELGVRTAANKFAESTPAAPLKSALKVAKQSDGQSMHDTTRKLRGY